MVKEDFSKWSKERLVDFLMGVQQNLPEVIEYVLDCYDEWMRGN